MVLPALIILCREILVSGLREFLAELQCRPAGQPARQMEDRRADGGARLPPGRRCRPRHWITRSAGLGLIWIAAGLTLITGYDYLRTGLRHMAEDAPPGAAE